MRAPRSLLLILGGTALVVGAVLAFAPYSQSIDLASFFPDGRSRLMSQEAYDAIKAARIPCERPITGAWSSSDRDGGWFNYAPNSSVTFSPGDHPLECTSSARWRLGGGVVSMLGGIAALVLWTRQSRLGREPADDVSASSPPLGEGSPDPTPDDPSPS
jgi:hypothetical protein